MKSFSIAGKPSSGRSSGSPRSGATSRTSPRLARFFSTRPKQQTPPPSRSIATSKTPTKKRSTSALLRFRALHWGERLHDGRVLHHESRIFLQQLRVLRLERRILGRGQQQPGLGVQHVHLACRDRLFAGGLFVDLRDQRRHWVDPGKRRFGRHQPKELELVRHWSNVLLVAFPLDIEQLLVQVEQRLTHLEEAGAVVDRRALRQISILSHRFTP